MTLESLELFMAQRRLDEGMFWETNEDSLELISDMLCSIVCDWQNSETDEVSGCAISTISSALIELLARRSMAQQAFQEANKHNEMKELVLVYVNPRNCPEHRRTVLVTLEEEKKEKKEKKVEAIKALAKETIDTPQDS